MPELEMVDLTLLQLELTTFHCAGIQTELDLPFPKPFSRGFVMGWKEQSERPNRLFDKSGREEVAMGKSAFRSFFNCQLTRLDGSLRTRRGEKYSGPASSHLR